MAVITVAAAFASAGLALRAPVPVTAPLPPLGKPISVRFQLVDGVRVSGEMTACDDDGFDGSFGRRLWTDLNADDAWKLHERVMDAKSSPDWINLGRVMLLLAPKQPRAAVKADTAFRRALQIDPESQSAIDRVKEDVTAQRHEAREAQRRAEAAKLTTVSPEAGPWSADPWPALMDSEQASAILSMKADAEKVLKQASVSVAPAETAHFIVYSEVDRPQTAEWALRLEHALGALEFVLNPGIDPAAKDKPTTLKPWGKIVVFIWKEQDRFKMVEAESFRHLVPNAAVAACHFTGPKAFVNAWRVDDDEKFEWMLITETVHGLLHRHRSPKRPPAWANDGLADMVASRVNKFSNFGHDRRKAALEFIRKGGDLSAVLDRKYEDASFPGQDGLGAPIGELVLELMLNQKPANFVKWFNAVKAGSEWVAALKEQYGTSRDDIVNIATQYYKMND